MVQVPKQVAGYQHQEMCPTGSVKGGDEDGKDQVQSQEGTTQALNQMPHLRSQVLFGDQLLTKSLSGWPVSGDEF